MFPSGHPERGIQSVDASSAASVDCLVLILKSSRVLTAAVTLAILVLSLTPQSSTPDPLHNDKAEHVTAYAALGLLAFLATGKKSAAVVLASIGVCSLYGGLIEIIQPYFGRAGELGDWIADICGALAGTLLGVLARSLLDQRARVR
jgi:VanZ family protein